MNETKNAVDTLDKQLEYPVTQTEIVTKARKHWSDNPGVLTFFETLPAKTYYAKSDIMDEATKKDPEGPLA